MSEQDWWSQSADPRAMLEFIGDRLDKAQERKLGFFTLACCREIWGKASDPPTVAALALAEHLVETRNPRPDRIVQRVQAGEVVIDCGASEPPYWSERGNGDHPVLPIVLRNLNPVLAQALERLACFYGASPWWLPNLLGSFAELGIAPARQAHMLRDVIRGPRQPLVLRSAWLHWNDGAVRHIAEHIGREQAFDELPILQDALLDAGCDNDELLGHCCHQTLHVRGCWVLSWLLGKE